MRGREYAGSGQLGEILLFSIWKGRGGRAESEGLMSGGPASLCLMQERDGAAKVLGAASICTRVLQMCVPPLPPFFSVLCVCDWRVTED